MRKNQNPHAFLIRMKIRQPPAKHLAVPQIVKHKFTRFPNNSTPRNLPKKNEIICPHNELCVNGHSTTTRHSPTLEKSKRPSAGCGQQNAVHASKALLLHNR